jgi:hypothetical protein
VRSPPVTDETSEKRDVPADVQCSVNGERRSFALLRPILDTAAQDRIRDVIREAHAEHEAEAESVR